MGKNNSTNDNVTIERSDSGGLTGALGAIIANVTVAPTHSSVATDTNSGESKAGTGTDHIQSDRDALQNLKK